MHKLEILSIKIELKIKWDKDLMKFKKKIDIVKIVQNVFYHFANAVEFLL
jgi:hypothetical protein